MRRISKLVVALALVSSSVGVFAAPAHACAGDVCDWVNQVCRKVGRGDCVG